MKTITFTSLAGIILLPMIIQLNSTKEVKHRGSVFSSVQTGELKGTVSDKVTGKTIAFANVHLKDDAAISIASSASDSQGNYYFKNIPSGKYKMEVSVPGYIKYSAENIVVSSAKTTFHNIKLQPETVIIKELEVREQKLEYKKIEADYSVAPAYDKQMSHSGVSTKQANAYQSVGSWGHTNNFNTEAYDHISENDFKNVTANPLSTFSIDVDAASYSNVRRFVNNGQTPPKDAIRIEEMINYFSYDYPNPEGEHPFSITTEMSECPWNKKNRLVHIGLQGKKIHTENLPPNNLTFLIDVSGSMQSPNKLPLLKKSFALLVDQMREQDMVAIVVYAGAAGLVLEPTSGKNKEKILEAIEHLEAGGSTAGGAGIKLAYKTARENYMKKGNNRVILATDGDFNIGASSDGEMVELIEKERESGIFITVLGFGMGNYKDSKMEKIADKGNGNYAYIDNLMEAKKVLVNEMGATLLTIAKDVKIQVEFNPEKVSSYKLIGYENRLLNEEDFNDDTKDAGELGAGHTVTALYEIVPADGENARSVDPLRYQANPDKKTVEKSAFGDELLTVKFRYKDPHGTVSKLIVKNLKDKHTPLENASNDFKFSAAVAGFGLLARDSKHKGNSNYSSIVKLAQDGKGNDLEGYRSEFIRMVEMYQLLAKN
jgi:Ca-activated chloride channel homolog